MKNKTLKLPTPFLGSRGVKFDILVKRFKTGNIEEIQSGHNLILDSGLANWANNVGASLTNACAVGTDTTPVERDSSTTTASQTGSTVTSSGNFFEAGDVGRLIKFDTGEEKLITTFNSATSVEVDDSIAVASSEFTIYYVNQTGLQAESARTATKRTESGDNGTTLAAGVITHKRTHLFGAVGAPVTYNEIGFSHDSAVGNNLFNRAIISGGVSLGVGDQLIVVSNLEVVQSPQTSTPQLDVGVGGINTTGQVQIEGIGQAAVTSTGGTTSTFDGFDNSNRALEPSGSGSATGLAMTLSESTEAFTAYGVANTTSSIAKEDGFGSGAYSVIAPSLRQKLKSTTFPTTLGNSANINCCYLGYEGGAPYSGVRVRFDNPQTKLNTQTLNLQFAIIFGRLLVNS